jgi:hypothetical protein
VTSIVLLVDDDPTWRPHEYQESEWGCGTTFRFRPVKLLDWAGKVAELEAHPNPVALFVLACLESRRTRNDPDEGLRVKLRLILNLLTRRIEPDDLRHWYRYLDWLLPCRRRMSSACMRRSLVTRRRRE